MRRTISSDDFKPDGKFQTNLTKRSQSYEPKLAMEQMENKYAATDLRKNIIAKKVPIAKKIDKKQDELLFAEKLLQRKLASEPGAVEGTNFKPRTDYDSGPGMVRTISTPNGTGTEMKKRSNTRRLSLPDVDPKKQEQDLQTSKTINETFIYTYSSIFVKEFPALTDMVTIKWE